MACPAQARRRRPYGFAAAVLPHFVESDKFRQKMDKSAGVIILQPARVFRFCGPASLCVCLRAGLPGVAASSMVAGSALRAIGLRAMSLWTFWLRAI